MDFKSRGFTLIELLIVVAIIAILAAIAVPNFLEAQTRSKVTRCRADVRSLVTALEVYRVDNHHYVPHHDLQTDLCPLSTPIAYITSIPIDPFKKHAMVYPDSGPYYVWQDYVDIYKNYSTTWGGGDWLARTIAQGKIWSISSYGPDGKDTQATDGSAEYDPTNGTVSVGDIYRMGP